MSSQVLKILFIGVLALGASPSLANEEAPKEAPKKEEKKDEWTAVQTRVSALEVKIKSSQEEIQKLIEEKAKTKDPQKSNEIIQQMLSLHKEMTANVKEYDQQRSLLKYRYPEKDFKGDRQYERIELKSLEDMESQLSLSSSVKKTLKKVRTQYDGPEDKKIREEKKEAAKEKPASSPSLIDPVILKK
ncbi:hypothetical protein D3C87_111010 [compost metagenome]